MGTFILIVLFVIAAAALFEFIRSFSKVHYKVTQRLPDGTTETIATGIASRKSVESDIRKHAHQRHIHIEYHNVR